MSEYNTFAWSLAAAELAVSPETAQYSDKVCAKEVRVVNTSGNIVVNVPYVVSDWQTQVPTSEFSLTLAPNAVMVVQLQGAGVYRFEAANASDAAAAGVSIVFSAQNSKFRKPIIKRGMIKRMMNGVTRRSA